MISLKELFKAVSHGDSVTVVIDDYVRKYSPSEIDSYLSDHIDCVDLSPPVSTIHALDDYSILAVINAHRVEITDMPDEVEGM